MQSTAQITVLNRDAACDDWLHASKRMKVVKRVTKQLAADPNIFVMVAASRLTEVAEFVKDANRRHHLRGLLVHADLDERWIGQMLDRAQLRTLRNLLVHRGGEQPSRVLNAWRIGAQTELIADAVALPESLLALSCAMERLEVPWSEIPPLADLECDQRGAFEISSDGSYIHWPESDVHLDLEALRVVVDPEAKERARLDRLRHAQRFGEAVVALRKAKGLRQQDIEGVTDRQMRRIEAGEVFPRLATLDKLAAAHAMTRAAYLDELALRQP